MIDRSIEELLKENIQASNRTTHAVRAFVLFLFVQLTFATAAWGTWQVGLAVASSKDCGLLPCSPDDGWSVAVTLLVTAGIWISSQIGWNELAKSKVSAVAYSNSSSLYLAETSAPQGSTFTHEDLKTLLADYVENPIKFMDEFLTPDQVKAWAKSGAPHLGAWINLGMPKFETWLRRTTRS